MAIKGVIQESHIGVNKFAMFVVGLPPLTPTTVGGLEEEIASIELPDKTTASGGRTGIVELTMSIPTHHVEEEAAMEIWFLEGQDPVLPTYKKAATLTMTAIDDGTIRAFAFTDLWCFKRTLPDRELDNDGEMSATEWGLKASQMLPLPIA